MECYILKQDDHVSNYPRIKDTKQIRNVFGDVTPMYCETKEYSSSLGYIELPFIDKPCFIVSDEIKKIFSSYQEGGQFRTVMFSGKDGYSVLYHFYQPVLIDCLSDVTVFYSKKTVKELVLDGSKIGANKVFQVAGLSEKYLIVDLEILEIMLCNGIYPIVFQKVAISRETNNGS